MNGKHHAERRAKPLHCLDGSLIVEGEVLRTRSHHEIMSVVAAALLVAVLAVASGYPAKAGTRNVAAEASSSAVRYFVDFRARKGHIFGHTIVVYGKFNERGEVVEAHSAGLYPIDNQSGLIVGSLLPVDGSVRAVKGDFKGPFTAVYHRLLTAGQYNVVNNAVHFERARENYWHLIFFNCNDFVARIAAAIGLRTPPTLLLPPRFVAELKAMNEN